jgi:RNA polymerase subunit RPABC4/transcription elongation factor Spt4
MANPATQKCPACGAESTGRFCSACGAPLAGAACAKCGAQLSARAKFCPACGAPSGGGAAARPLIAPNQRAAWIVAGVCAIALIVTVVVVVARRAPTAPGEAAASGAGAPATTDLSQMSPAEQATRLFDRVMRAQESGDTGQVTFFAPMAIQAYQMLGPGLDPDARLHVGLLQLAVKNPAGARAQADTLLKGSRTHLYGLLLKARAAEASGDAATARSALQAFVANYDAERAKKLPEYAEHDQLLIETRDQATRGAGATAKR